MTVVVQQVSVAERSSRYGMRSIAANATENLYANKRGDKKKKGSFFDFSEGLGILG